MTERRQHMVKNDQTKKPGSSCPIDGPHGPTADNQVTKKDARHDTVDHHPLRLYMRDTLGQRFPATQRQPHENGTNKVSKTKLHCTFGVYS